MFVCVGLGRCGYFLTPTLLQIPMCSRATANNISGGNIDRLVYANLWELYFLTLKILRMPNWTWNFYKCLDKGIEGEYLVEQGPKCMF